jgi:hypothetical protein
VSDVYSEGKVFIMRIGCFSLLSIAVLLLAGAAQVPKEQRYAVLPSRSVPRIPARVMHDVDSYGSWEPSKSEIDGLESDLPHVSELRITGWSSNIHIEHPEEYFRQYVGVSHRGQRRIYVNAFCVDPPPSDWRDHLYVVVDGATCFWQALYDPIARTFSDLTINARA